MDCMTCLAVQKTKYELFDKDYILMNNLGIGGLQWLFAIISFGKY